LRLTPRRAPKVIDGPVRFKGIIVSREELDISVQIIAQDLNTAYANSSSFPDVLSYLCQIDRSIRCPIAKSRAHRV
jgi:hypothetical protein